MNLFAEWWSSVVRIAPLAVPVCLGALAAKRGLLRDVPRAIDALNVFALYFAFPALVASSVAASTFAIPREWGFWVVVPLSAVALVALCRPLGRLLGDAHHAGTLALVVTFGNVAYLGLPYSTAAFGEEVAGVAALAVAVHIAIAVTAGPALLRRWGGTEGGVAWGAVLRQPLLWAPAIGLVARAVPEGPRGAGLALIAPLAAGAAPVALFMLGLYLASAPRGSARSLPVFGHTVLRVLVAPVLTAGVAVMAHAWGGLDAEHAAVFVLLAGMPAAITTFAFARDARIGEASIAGAIVQSTLAALFTLPLLAVIASALARALAAR